MLLYDIIIAARDVRGKKILTRMLEDFVFWQMCAGGLFYFLYTLNEGIIRGYELAAFFFGMILFQNATGRKMTKGLKKYYIRYRIKIRILFDRFNG